MSSPRTAGPVFSFRAIGFAIALAAIVPTLAFSGLLMLRYAESERARAERGLIESARGIARALDGQFTTAEAMLLALRDSVLLSIGDLAAFEARMRRTAAQTGRHFALVEPSGQQLINTFFPRGQQLPRHDPKLWGPVFAERRTVITDIFTGGSPGQLLAAVGVPVVQDDAVKWALTSTLYAKEFARLVDEPGVPNDWIVSIVDRTGRHIARSHNPQRFVGQPLVPALVDFMRSGRTGTTSTVSLEGIPLISTVQRALRSQWGAAVGLPVALLEAPINRSLRDLALIGLVVAAAALALAYLAARLLDQAMSGLTRAAAGLGRREVVEAPGSMVSEANAVGNVLAHASRELHDLTTSLETQVAARTAQLSDANAKLREEIQRRQESEAQVMQMQKIEAMGQLTGGIAHDFNNMLAIVLGSLRLLQRRIERGETDVQKYIDGAIEGAERAASLTTRLLAFSRQQALMPEVLDCNKMIAAMNEILRRTIPENVQIETVLAGGLWRTYADAQGLESAIINLAVNARDAMPDGGKLTIETANCLLDEAYAASRPDVTAGQYVMIAVADTGAGMTPDVIDRAFDPFFTTKPAGYGTGLGLSQVHGFIKQSGGSIAIYSEVGQGTTVKLYLPRFNAVGTAPAVRADASAVPRSANGETILVVEDEPEVRKLAIDMLRELGYATLEADSAADALELLDQHPEIDLLFTDVVMPDQNGRELAEEARKRRPDLAVLFTTGYTRNAIVHHGVLDPGVQVITKPHSLETLAQRVGELLQAKAKTPAGS
jgi:signal transduction histidine kinase/ActR/RegA family two-component response regulator